MSDTSGDLSRIRHVFVGSRDALDFVKARGLPKDAMVWTTAPALLESEIDGVNPIEDAESVPRLAKFIDATLPFCTDIRASLSEQRDLAPMAGLVPFTLMNRCFKMAKKALLLKRAHVESPCAIVDVDARDAAFNGILNIPWNQALEANPNLLRITAPLSGPRIIDLAKNEVPPLLERLKFLSWESLGVKLFLRYLSELPTPPMGSIVVMGENPLTLETAWYLRARGFAIRTLKPGRPLPVDTGPIMSRLREVLAAKLDGFLSEWMERRVATALGDRFWREMASAVETFLGSLMAWERAFDTRASWRIRAFLMNIAASPGAYALIEALHRRHCPIVAFQHGHSRELDRLDAPPKLLREETSADLVFTFNDKAAEITRANPLGRAAVHAVGTPLDYARTNGYRRRRSGTPEILYVSTLLYSSHVQYDIALPDFVRAKREIELVDQVLARVPRRILYKPYPKPRFADPDPVVVRAKATDNITVFGDFSDLRYSIQDTRVVVTSRATSTLGWVLLSGRPTVFIDWPDDMPLRQDARHALEGVLFYFDAGQPDFHVSLRTFLSQPIESIERQWAERATLRDSVIKAYFSLRKHDAGREAAGIVANWLDGRAQSNGARAA